MFADNVTIFGEKVREGKMKKKRLKLKSHRIWISIIMFIVMSVFLVAAVAVTMVTMVSVIMETKLSDQISIVSGMADLYEEADAEKGERELVLMEYGREFFIRDKNGDVKYLYGDNTCVISTGEVIQTDTGQGEFRIYADSENRVTSVDEDGDIDLDYIGLIKLGEECLKQTKSGDKGSLIFYSEKQWNGMSPYVDLPMWISRELSNGDELFVKTDFSAKISSIATLVRLLVISAAIYGSLFILMMVYVIMDVVSTHRVKKQFFTDVATGGRNKTYFLYKGGITLRGVLKQKRYYVVLSVEMTRYLNYCLCYTLEEGEKQLAKMDRVIRDTLGKKTLVARMDNAVFGVLLEANDLETLNQMVDGLRNALSTMNSDHRLTYHIGGYLLRKETDGRPMRNKDYDIEVCYNNACAAMETLADREDSAFAVYDEKMIEDQRWESVVRDHQQKALDQEEFIVFYQPKYDPRTNKLRGAEALIRWQSPEYGFLTPYKFIPIFEKNGFITQIDHYMLEHVAKDQKQWLDQGLECVPVSVNVSRAHFVEDDLAEQIRDIVDAAGTPRNLIEIELTESAFFDDKNKLVDTINRLKEYGFTVSMDDFGSGYSSLNSLKDMPLDVLKLDAEFFRGENEGDRGRIVVAEAIRLAKSLHMRTVAEGVEVKDQVQFLADQDCDMIQGYYYAKPMPGNEYEERIRKGEEDPEK